MENLAIQVEAENRILRLRNTEVMIDRDVAELYGEDTAEINRKVRNNPEKFMGDLYTFDLTKDEKARLINEYPRLEGVKFAPNVKAYTEYGIMMLSTTFQKSNEVASKICHILVNTFVEYRKKLQENNNADSVIFQIKRDIELLKKFALSQYEKNEEFAEHLGIAFEKLNDLENTQKKQNISITKNQIGFAPKNIYPENINPEIE